MRRRGSVPPHLLIPSSPHHLGWAGVAARPLKILLAASEAVGFAKTGGLADVAGSLPRALARRGHSCAVILPLFRCARTGPVSPTEHRLSIPVGDRTYEGRLWRGTLPDSEVPVYLV